MITVNESGMTFGPFGKEDIFCIEKSDLRQKIAKAKAVEFVVFMRERDLCFVEAKSSSPRTDNEKNFAEFIEEISQKFLHSLNLYYSLILGRNEDSELSGRFLAAKNAEVKLKMCLVINGHKIEWLPPICVALKKALIPYISIWKFDVVVLNEAQAEKKGLIKKNRVEE